MKPCLHCGAPLREEASFCPYCAQAVNVRREISPPRRMPRRVVCGALFLLIAAVELGVLFHWSHSRPRVYDNDGTEVIYRDQGVDYQVCIAWGGDPFTPAPRTRDSGSVALDEHYRYPVQLYANLTDGETPAAELFLERVESITGEIADVEENFQITCSEVVRDTDYAPDSAAVLYLNLMVTGLGPHTAELAVSFRMKNGDVIRLRQTQRVEGIMTYDFTADDAPLDTAADLEAFLAKLEGMVGPEDVVNIHLPAVTYTEELTIEGRPVNLIGTEDETGARTTFAAPVRVTMEDYRVLLWENLDFRGPGAGTGLSLAARAHLTGCRVSGWDTGVLAHTEAWVKADESVFQDNAVGFCFDAEAGGPSDDRFVSDIFRNNGVAVALYQVPNQMPLLFPGCRFEGNGQDIDNRCGQTLDLDQAIFT